MYGWSKLNKNESGQAALEAAIILIAFVVVASVFAFAILSAGSASTEKGEQAIYSGLQGVQSSMELKGTVVAEAKNGAAVDAQVNHVVFTVASVAGGDPVNLADGFQADCTTANTPTAVVVVAYHDDAQTFNSLPFCVTWITTKGTADDLLEEGELAEISVDLADVNAGAAGLDLTANKSFSLEVKPPTGGVVQVNRTVPAALAMYMELR